MGAGGARSARWLDAGAPLLLTLWAGSLWTAGYLVAPVLFSSLTRTVAGEVAGRIFELVAWLGMLALPLLVIRAWFMRPRQKGWVAACLAVALVVVLAGHFGVLPHMQALKAALAAGQLGEMEFRAAFGRLHGLSSALYLVQALLAAAVVSGWRRGFAGPGN